MLAWPLAVLSFAGGLGWAWRESRRPIMSIVIQSVDCVSVDDQAVDSFVIVWRGRLAFLRWRDAGGRYHARSLWPDTLSPTLRRELKLLLAEKMAVRQPESMAP